MVEDKPTPLVSIIIPTYNSQKSIKKCLESIKNQYYKRIEILVADRHSRDATTLIARQHNAKMISLDAERSEAKNYAAKNAYGDFLLFIDSDMILHSKVIEECVNTCIQKNVDAIIIPEKYIGEGMLGKWKKDEKTSLSATSSKSMEIPRFFRKSAFLHVHGYDEKLVCGEDFDLFQRFEKLGYKTAKIDSEIFHFEGRPSLRSILSKAYWYGKTFPALIQKNPSNTIKRYFIFRLTFLKNANVTFGNADSLVGFNILKLFEYFAYFLGISSQLLHMFSEKCRADVLKNGALKNRMLIANFAIILLIATVIFRNFLFTSEWPGGGDVLGFVSRAYLYGEDFKWLSMWRPYSFGFVEGINSMDFFLMSLYLAFRDPSWTVKAFMFLSYLAAGFFMYLFAYRYTREHVASLSASLVYILNQWLFSQLTEAHVDIILSYALAPLIFILLDKALQTSKPKSILLLSVGLSLFLTGFHPECVVIYGVFLVIYVAFFILFPTQKETAKTRFFRLLKVSLPSALIVFLLSSFFLIPFLIDVRSPYMHPSYEYPLDDAFWGSYRNVTDAFTLRAIEKWGYENIVDVYSGLGLADFPVYTALLIIFLLAYSTLLIRRDRFTIFFALSTIISVFIAKGPHPPFGHIFVWAWFNVPHFAIFRAANRWIMMAIFSHAFFVSLLVCCIKRYITEKNSTQIDEKYFELEVKNSGFSKVRRLRVSFDDLNVLVKKLRRIIYILSIVLLIFIFLSGFFSCFFFFFQGLQVYTPSEQYLAPYEWLARQQDDYKVVSVGRSHYEWVISPDQYSDFASSAMQTSLGWGHDIGFDSSFIHDKPVLQDGGWDFKPRQFIDHLRFRLGREHLTDNLLKILGAFAYKYIVIPPYATNKTREFFLNQEGYQILYNQTALILENEYAAPRVFATNNSMLVLGGLESFDALCKIDGFKLSENLMFFVPEISDNFSLEHEAFAESQMFCFVNTDVLDLAMLSLEMGVNIIYAGHYGASSLNHTAYWVKMPSWRNVGALVLSGSTLTTSGKNKANIPFEVGSEGCYDVWLRIGLAPSRGKLSIFVDGEYVQEIRPEYPLWSKLAWINIASLNLTKGGHLITLENDGTGYNDVDAIAIVKPSELDLKINQIMGILQNFNGRLLYMLDAKEQFLGAFSRDWYWTVIPYNGYIIRLEGLGSNVASLATANATSSSNSFEESCAIDENLGTRWTSEKGVLPQWLELTWDKPQTLYGVRIFFEYAYATDYLVQTWNGTCWINQTTVMGNNVLENTHEFTEPIETEKLRVYVTAFSVHDRVSIWELEAYSAGTTSSPAKITIPRKGNYMLAARIGTGPQHGTLYLNVNGTLYSIPCNDSISQFEWYEIGPFSLDIGELSISIGGKGLVEIDKFVVYSLKDGENSLPLSELFSFANPRVSIEYEKVNSYTFQVNVNANETFTLIFSETYNPLWKALIDGQEIPSIPAYSIVNSFYINKTGQFTITINFIGQSYADTGLIISVGSLITIVVLLLAPSKFFRKLESVKQIVSKGKPST